MLERMQRSLRPHAPWQPPAVDWSPMPVRMPKRKKGSRPVSMATRGHNSSIVVDPNDFLAKELESGIEHNAYLVLTADPRVVSIECQAPPVEYADRDGVVHEHTFDFRIGIDTGMRTAVMVKKASKVRRAQLETLAADLANQIPDSFADAVMLITEEDLPEWLVANARLIRSARLDKPCARDGAILERAKSSFEPMSIEELCRPFAPFGARSVARLLYSRDLRQVEAGLIEPTTMVVATATGEALT
ncbi:hypothetical protein JP74_18505 [Devosia sp. 17-2-E-8]|nr:hypothetical protein JP74_18505 [Devosia sp. 17-2-E-8]